MKQKSLVVTFKTIFLFALSTFSVYSYVLTRPMPLIVFPKGSTYEKEWKKVDSLANKGLNKSALEVVEGIYKHAKQENNAAQLVKAIIHRMKFEQMMEEYAIEKSINRLEQEVKQSRFPATPVLHSILAEQYWHYYENNRWKFYNRTQTVSFKNDDITTWDLRTITDHSIKEYILSLQQADSLKRVPLDIYDEVISKQTDSRKFRPTLYDFVAHRAVDFFSNEEPDITKPAHEFRMDSESYFWDLDAFTKLKIESPDSMGLKYYAINILQDLLRFHQKDTSANALVDVDLERLKLVKNKSIVEGRDSLYLDALQKLEKRFLNRDISTEVSYAIADEYFQRGEKFSASKGDENKWMKKKALEICEAATKRFPNSNGALNCKHLAGKAREKSLAFTVEEASVPNKPFRSLLTWKNVRTVYVRVAKMDIDKYNKAIFKKYGEELIKEYLKLPAVKEWAIGLPDDGDYNAHSSEIKVPALPAGHYVLLAGSEKTFKYKNEGIAYAACWSTNISYVNRMNKDGTYDFYVLNRETGIPMKNVSAQLYFEKYNYSSREYEYAKGQKFITDDNGYFNVPAPNDYRYFEMEFIDGTDKLFTDNYLYQNRYYKEEKKKYPHTYYFTDRKIYRPGQTIYFKGIMIESDGETSNIMPNRTETVTLYDVNYQKISSLTLTTNEYGTFNGSFTAPNGVLNGQMHLGDTYGTTYFSVEDYKRPKFEVAFKPVKGAYKLNEMVKAIGAAKAYSGANIDGAEVKYRVVRNASFPYWFYWWRGYYPQSPEMEITNGATITNDTGGFFIDFKAIPDASISKAYEPTYTYTVYADVTDINGETHSGTSYIYAAYQAMNLNIELMGYVNKEESFKAPVVTSNFSGEPEPAQGKIEIWKLKQPDKVQRRRLWDKPDKFLISESEYDTLFPKDIYNNEDQQFSWKKENKVLEKNFSNTDAGKGVKPDTLKLMMKTWTAGDYVMEAHTKDRFGEDVKDVKFFTVFSPNEKMVPAPAPDWFTALKQNGEPGEKARFLIGTRENNVKMLYEVEHKGVITKKEWLTLNNEQRLVEVPIEEKHRGNFSVHFVFVKDNRSYQHDAVVTVPYTNKELDIEFETFRNKLLPGQNEEWKLKIKDKKGDKLAAEMLATMYDASLDAFAANSFYLGIYNSYYSELNWSSNLDFGTRNSQLWSVDWNPYLPFYERYYDQLNWFGYYYGSYGRRGYLKGDYFGVAGSVAEEKPVAYLAAPKAKDSNQHEADKKEGEMRVDDSISTETTATGNTKSRKVVRGGTWKETDGDHAGDQTDNLSAVKARSNFAETAFFYPSLETDDKGNVVIKFTVPEALTKWKILGLAHTKDLKIGTVQKELVTQKDLMVVPNAPRFFRENDQVNFSAKISNLSDKDLDGKAELILYDATTMKDITTKVMLAVHGQFETIGTRPFSVQKGKSTALDWELQVPEGIGAITYKVVAKANNFSDGEEMAVPVLTNRMLVTESMPLPVRSKQTKTFSFDKFISQNGGSTTLRNHKLTLEFTANPAWYAVQALPYMMEYPYECAEQTFSRFYANAIASHIANSSPKIKAVFDSWRSQSPDALLSNLEKNQELKSLMLEETPWVLDAKDETERKKRVALLFDMNKMANEFDRALRKLQKMQTSNGGWPWFEGEPDDRYITQHIVTGMGHLDHLGVKSVREDSKTWNMVQNGVRYLDERIREDYEWILKHDKEHLNEDHIWYEQIQYLYARSYFKDISISGSNQKAFDYYKGQAQKYWLSKGRYMQGMIALALKRYDDKKTPLDIMKSLKENSLNSEEMGMYWKDNYEDGWYWWQAPIESQALLIEAFDEVTNDKKAVDDLKVWLLKSKQTQDWKTTKATTEACYALLLRGTDWLATESNVEILVGSMQIDPKNMPDVKTEAGTGYFKTSWSGSDIKPEMGKVTVTKKDEGVSWGAMYWQYFEQLDKITPAKTPLHLEKKLFLQKNTASGPVIEPLTKDTKLKVGDKLKVRIELRVDRDMEYVHMKDMRASGFEPTNVFSQYKWQDGLGYYESTRDASTNFFFSRLPKGTYVFEYPLVISHRGNFSNGITSIQCMYAPEFASHSEGVRVYVGK